jgi:hypothetical protein
VNREEIITAIKEKSDLRGAGMRGVNLRGANLRGANLSEADLSWVDLSEAGMRGVKLIHHDSRRRYNLYLLPMCKEPMLVAGCRCFTVPQALEHWGEQSSSRQPKYIAAIRLYFPERAQ